jgi:4-amino-4-deoxy-L-arabinose transferase-like glycosyltransferase
LTYLLGERLFGRAAAVLAGLIACVYPFFLLLVHLPLTESLSIFLTLALITLIYYYRPRCHVFLWSGSIGVIFGITLLNKAANIVVFPCLGLWALWELRAPVKKRIVALGIIVLAAGIIMLPWIVRNYRIIGAVVPVNSNGGWTFYLGNNLHTEQNLRDLEQGTATGWTPPQEVFLPLADLAFTESKAREQRAVRLGLEFIRSHPGKFAEFAFRKVKIFWTAYPHILDNVSWYPIAMLSVLGIWWSFASWKQYRLLYLLILSSMSIPVVFTSMPRFRAPLLPFLIMFASFALVTIGRKWYADRN